MGIFQFHYDLTGPPLYMWSVDDQNIVMWCIIGFIISQTKVNNVAFLQSILPHVLQVINTMLIG